MISLRCIYKNKKYKFISFLGILITKNVYDNDIEDLPKFRIKNLNRKITKSIEWINNPYIIEPQYPLHDKSIKTKQFIKLYANLIIWLSRHFYFGLYLCSFFRFNILENSFVSATIFSKIHPNEQHLLCLARSVFIATTSKTFKEKGTMYIGIFPPTKRMHAWVMEDKQNVYKNDTIWINFIPISSIV